MEYRDALRTAVILTALACILVVCATGCGSFAYVGTDTCLKCHNGKYAMDRMEFLESRHEPIGCETCHGPGLLHVRLGGRRGLFINGAPDTASLCVRCHETETQEFNLSGHAVAGVLGCLDCHDPHGRQVTVRPASDNQLCLQCHAYTGFGTVSDIVAHTWHDYDPVDKGTSRCVTCHMTPTDRLNQDGTRTHSLIPVRPIESNLAGVTPAPPNSCAGIIGCHDGSVSTAPIFDVDDPRTNEWLQTLYDFRYGS